MTCSFPLQLNTADLHQQQLCGGLGGELEAGVGGLEGMSDTPNETLNNPGAAYAGPLFQSHAPEKCRTSLQLLHCPPRNRTI